MTFTFPLYIPLLVLLVSVLCAVGGIMAIKAKKKASLSGGLFFIAAFGGGLIFPSMLIDKVELGEDTLEQATGFWFGERSAKGFVLKDLAFFEIVIRKNDRGREEEIWIAHYLDGSTHTVDPGDLWVLHSEAIEKALTERGITVNRVAKMVAEEAP